MYFFSSVKNNTTSFSVRDFIVLPLIILFCTNCSAQDYAINKNREIVQYLNSNFGNRIRNVSVNKNSIIIKADVSNNKSAMYLCELRMYDDTKMMSDSFASVTPIDPRQPSFKIEIKRFVTVNDTGYDRLYSRWVIASKNGKNYQLQSFAHYADDVYDAANQYLPEEKPANKKGLAGFAAGSIEQDLTDLNIKNITINVVLPNFISLTPTEYSYTFNGQTYYFNPGAVNNFEKTIKLCSDNDIIVTALVLIPRNITGPLKSIFVYAKANAGVHTMANITSLTGLNYYAAVVGFLAERYGRPDKKYGIISNWVIHNEVDNASYWANAGTSQMEYYTELYDRSARTVYYTVRQYNPAAKVFLCFTHFWASAARAGDFAPKDMLTVINKLSNKEGDYEWGIAYHPYAEDLRDPKPWDDKDVTLDLNTSKYITPKNIGLIDEWLRMKAHLYKGLKVRTLMFTEQGVDTKSYSKEDLLTQAAGLAYMWKKCSRLPTLEAFDYHLQTDNHYENGMMFGLWTVKEGTKGSPDKKKPSWYVYQKAGTPSEDDAFAFALPIIGISNWSQIYNNLPAETTPYTVTFNITINGNPLNDVSIYFDGEMHKTINGKATFYNVASVQRNRNIRLMKNGQLLSREQNVMINKDQNISIDVAKR
ncbi:MAG: DUF5722 domain-containing protein [Chitinophagaceae bacterium]